MVKTLKNAHNQFYSNRSLHIKMANRKIIHFLRKKNLLKKGRVSKGELVAAVVGYLYSKEANGIAGFTKKRILTKRILAAADLYGGKAK